MQRGRWSSIRHLLTACEEKLRSRNKLIWGRWHRIKGEKVSEEMLRLCLNYRKTLTFIRSQSFAILRKDTKGPHTCVVVLAWSCTSLWCVWQKPLTYGNVTKGCEMMQREVNDGETPLHTRVSIRWTSLVGLLPVLAPFAVRRRVSGIALC